MTATSATSGEVRQIKLLLRGEPEFLRAWSESWDAKRLALCLGVIVVGTGLYGAAMGCWRDPRQALFVAIKFPMIILLTTIGNAMLNAMLAPLLGLDLNLRQSFLAILMSFTIAAAILGSFSPLAAFLVWNSPSMSSAVNASHATYNSILLAHVGAIAFAGTAANLRLARLLRQLSSNAAASRRVLLAWLAGNLFVGSQLSWILRPFIGSPTLPVEFLRPTAFHGNFYEAVFHSLRDLLNIGPN
jgi:hypothetical protein